MKERMNHDETKFETMILSIDDYQRSIVDQHEIKVGGEMYDVKSVRYVQDKVELTVIHDKHEGNIIKKIKYALESNSDNPSTLPIKSIKLISLQYLLPSEYVKLRINLFPTIVRNFHNDVYSLTAISLEVISPPPQIVS